MVKIDGEGRNDEDDDASSGRGPAREPQRGGFLSGLFSSDDRHSGNKSRFKIMARTQAEEDAFDVTPMRTGVRSGLFASVANLAKGALGGGILAGHVAYMTAGYVSGIFLTIIYGGYLGLSFYMLVLSSQILCRRTHTASMTYPDIGEAAFALFPNPKVAKWSRCYRKWIDFITCVNLFGSCAAYQLMVAKTIKQMVELTQTTTFEGLDGGPSLRAYVAIMIIPTIMICLITNMKYLAPFSLAANVIIVTVIATTIYYATHRNPDFENMVPFTSLYNQMMYTGMGVFSMSTAGVVIPVENNMKEPKKFYLVMLIGYCLIITSVFLTSFFGYTAFLNDCESPITINFPLDPFPKMLKVGIALMVYVTHGVNFFMPFECVFYYVKKRLTPDKYFSRELICRAIVVTIISCAAIAFPNIDALMGFLGCFCITNMAFICPNTIYVMVHYERPGWGKNNFILWRSIALSTLGVFILICGSMVSGKEMVQTLFKGGSTDATTTTAAPAGPAPSEV